MNDIRVETEHEMDYRIRRPLFQRQEEITSYKGEAD